MGDSMNLRRLWNSTLRLKPRFRLLALALLSTPLMVGGQAVIEGVMMRSPKSFAVAIRRRDGSIVMREQRVRNFLSRFAVFRWPLIRGAVVLLEALHNGITALNFAADQAMLDEESEQNKKSSLSQTTLLVASPGGAGGTVEQSSGNLALWGTLGLSFVLVIGIFVALPHLLGYLVSGLLPGQIDLDSGWFHLMVGGFKMTIFVLYVVAISRMEDIRRLFMYHGAEHKSVHTFEAKKELTVAEASPMSTAHPRCGTSLILWVVAISVLIFAAAFPFMPKISDVNLINHGAAILLKIPLLFPVAGLAYELQRFASRHPDSKILKVLIAPGMVMQSLTTRIPGDAELEVALAALRKVLWREQLETQDSPPDEQLLERFANFEEVVVKVG